MGSLECKKRYMEESEKSCWDWPKKSPNEEEMSELIGALLKISINFFFQNYVYTFGGQNYLQGSGGPIGARQCV